LLQLLVVICNCYNFGPDLIDPAYGCTLYMTNFGHHCL